MGVRGARSLLVAALGLAALATWPAASREAPAYGQRLVAQHRMSAETIAQYADFRPSRRHEGGSKRLQTLLADKVQWTGPAGPSGPSRNPYTLVLTVSGVAKAAGDVQSLWHTGWEVWETAQASRDVVIPIQGIARRGVSAGASLTLTATGGPVNFRGERQIAPMLGLVSADNLEIREVMLQVWSGPLPTVWMSSWHTLSVLLALASAALLGLAVLQRRRVGAARNEAPPTTPVRAPPLPRPTVTRPLVNQATADPPTSAAPQAAPVSAWPATHRQRVAETLSRVLTQGLAVPTVLDGSRPPRRRSRRA